MSKLKKQNPNPPKTLKERITLLEQALAEARKVLAALPKNTMNINDSILESLEQANGEQKSPPPLESLEQVNGQLEESPLDKIKKLEKVLATAQVNPFGTTDYSIFESSLDSKTMASLQDLAQRVGVNPWDSMPVLKKNLKTAFVQTNTQGTLKPRPQTKNVTLDPRDPKHLKVMQSLGMKVS